MGEMLYGGMQIIIPDVNPREFSMNLNDVPRVSSIYCVSYFINECVNA